MINNAYKLGGLEQQVNQLEEEILELKSKKEVLKSNYERRKQNLKTMPSSSKDSIILNLILKHSQNLNSKK